MADVIIIEKRLKALITIRAFFVTILLGSFFFFHIGYTILPYPWAVNYVIVTLYGLTIAYALLLGRVDPVPLAYAQFAIDLIAAMSLILVTGGVESWFNSLPLLIVIGAGIVLNRRAGYMAAIAGSLIYGSAIDLQFYRVIPIPYDPMHLEKDFFYNIFSHMTALFLTAYLVGHLSERLERKDIDFEDLSLFNREVIENVPSGLFTVDIHGTVLILNRAAEAITGMERGAAVGRHIGTVLPFLRSRDLDTLDRLEETIEARGSQRIIGLRMSEMRDTKGAPIGYIGMFQDLTELKALEREVKEKEKLAARGELSSRIAHEIRNPLAALKGSIEILKEGAITDKRKMRLMTIALDEMDRLNRILTEFLDYSRPHPPEKREFDLHAVLRNSVDVLRNSSDARISFVETFRGPLTLVADEQRLRQVIWNIGLNALEAMPEGGSLTIGTEVRNGVVDLTFADTGRGIAKDDLARIFYPFFSTRRGGTGLGLSIAHRIVEDHGGHITVDSSPGQGSTFHVVVPRGEGDGDSA